MMRTIRYVAFMIEEREGDIMQQYLQNKYGNENEWKCIKLIRFMNI